MKVNNFVGIDVSKEDFYACLHEKEPPRKFANSSAGARGFTQALKANNLLPRNTKIGLESTGPYHYLLSFICSKKGYTTHIINPLITNAYNKTTIRKIKTDQKDASLIRYVLTQGAGYPFTETTDTLILKNLVRARAYLSDMKRNMKRKAKDILYKEAIIHAPITDVNQEIFAVLSEKMKEIDRRLRTHDSAAQKLLQTIPGLGPTTAAALIAEITDIKRFSTSKHFTAFIGLDPRVRQSGTSINGKGYITKRGNKILRTLFYNCASVAIQRPNIFQDFYHQKVSEGKPKMVALIAATHKIAKVAYAVWKTNTPFDPNHGKQITEA
ncbi:MAG: IS110 family transposase [Patescibacteria group bacterium]